MRDTSSSNEVTNRTGKATHVRWSILTMLFIVTTVNYADRAAIAIAGPQIKQYLHMSSVEMGFVFSAFAWSYMLVQLPGGWLLDRFGSRITYFFSIFLWSVLTMMMGGVGFVGAGAAVAVLFGLRLLIGAAEGPAFPGNSRLTSAWFPAKERGTAAAVFNSSQYFATVLFAPIMGWLVHSYGWQSAFYLMGALGIVLAAIWLKVIYEPANHPRINAAEFQYLKDGGALVDLDNGAAAAHASLADSWVLVKRLMANRMLLGIYIGQYGISALTYFFLTWFPVYLVTERHMTILKAGFVSALPAIGGCCGGILGGVISGWLLQSGRTLTVARKVPIIIGLLLSMTMVICNFVSADWIVIAVMSLAFFGKGFGALGWAVVSDTSPKEGGGLSGALFNMFGNLAGITTPIVIGFILQATGSFAWALVFIGGNALVTIFAYLFIVGDIKRVDFSKPVVPQA